MKFDVEEYARMKRHFCGPDWRWKLARARVSSVSTGLIDEADQQVREVVDYLSQRAGGPDEKERAAQEFPHIAAAELLAEDSAGCGELKILVLGGCSPAEIGERLELDTTVLATWENLFFDVRAARGATDWILVKVIRPEQERGDQHLASKLKFAYAGGPLAAAAILDAESRVSLRQGVALFDKRIHLHLKCDQAAEVPIDTDRKKLFFIRMHVEIIHHEQRLRLAERRLEQKCREALWKQKIAETRLELRRKREEEQVAKSAEWEATRARIRDERKQAEKERAAQSALAQLRWEDSEEYVAGLASEQPKDVVQGQAEVNRLYDELHPIKKGCAA